VVEADLQEALAEHDTEWVTVRGFLRLVQYGSVVHDIAGDLMCCVVSRRKSWFGVAIKRVGSIDAVGALLR